ncbi:MAG: M24 family metallopeptidase [Lachnospiraceae bacterium]|nr:M24 family metallopeptidase [Lachnospiraceae bacterium]
MTIIEKKINLTLCENPVAYAYEEAPEFTAEDYKQRIEKALGMPQASEYNFLVIYGDREHFSNIHYFTGYDPRWEEALLILSRGNKPVLLVGNEGLGYTAGLVCEVQIEMYQTFSLMGQPNDERSRKLTDLLKGCGIKSSSKVGLIGWKEYRKDLFELQTLITDVPHYIVETLAQIAGMENITNATNILTDCEYGLKHTISAKEIIQFDLSGSKVSRGIYQCIKNLRPGMLEIEAAEQIGFDGQPGNMYPNINFGDAHVAAGLNSPKYDVKLEYGMPIGIGYGLRGCLVHKCGMYIRSAEDLPKDKKDYIEKLLKPYFACVVKWYEMMKIGTECGEIYQMVEESLGMEKFGISLNPGHLTHTDEWTNSPIQKGSRVKIHSGMAFQCDYTVGFQKPFMSAHIEDGLVIADAKLQKEIKELSPSCYKRIMERRKFITEVLNIELPKEVLPLSDLSCICFPYMADPSIVLGKEK